MISSVYRKAVTRWRNQSSSEANPAPVTVIQWLLVITPVPIALSSYEFRSYAMLALITQALVVLNVLLLIIVTREVLTTRTIGKFCLVGGTFIFYWLDAWSLSTSRTPFSIAEGFPINAGQFDQEMIQQALVYTSVFQLLLFVGFSIRVRIERPLRFFTARVDSLSLDRTLIAMLLAICSILPLLIYYEFDDAKIITALLASRSGTELEAPEPGLAQHVAVFGIYGASLFFVYALKTKTWQRFWWLFLGVLAALPLISGGARHIWLYISLPSLLIVLRGFKGSFTTSRLLALVSVALLIVIVAQLQIAYRAVGWKEIGNETTQELSAVNTNGQFTALLFAEYLVPNEHPYFLEPVEPYFLIHWIPRQIWPTKPIMETWTYYNDRYVEGAAFNVTPSAIGQFHMSFGLAGVIFIGAWLGFLTLFADRLLLQLNSDRQRAMFVVVGMFYAFIISSFRFYSPIYFSYFLFGVLAMFLLTRRATARQALVLKPQQLPA